MDSTTSNNSNTSDTSHGTKEILKFLRPSPFKLARKSYFQGFSYLTSVFPIYPLLIKFGTFIILLQIYIPSMLLGITTLFPKDQLIYRVARTLSFFTHFFPIGTEIEYCENFVWIFAAISFENHILALISTIFFAKTSTIPKWLVGLSYISETTRKFFTVPAACSTAVNIIFQKNLSIYQIALFSIDIICLFFNFFEHVFFGFYSLFFLPISLSTYSQVSQNIINLSLIIFPLCSAILEFVSDNIKIIVVAIMLCFYLAFYLFFLLCGLVIDKTERIALNATNATAIVSTAVVFFFTSLWTSTSFIFSHLSCIILDYYVYCTLFLHSK
ncbi:hypothetical protein TRFO_33036 [Tritrichomonas foetus]|uniref:Uncharacterized protein n=1 Tax=Tritrichomonas foetus TaxID=1144522 RepID=A0A1J4JSP5_9EUKA|nr:hypothetical protein TRFO_33036 [Tritrichomonas foetus]|eukprot:OHT00285.1 hypothetical protein TRFO_33036 [Tritrichomonas foetus]